jgi:hypothetical protein
MTNETVELVLLNPRGEIETKPMFAPAPRVADLNGKRIALVHNQKAGASTFLDAMEGFLKIKYPDSTFLRQFEATINLAKEPAFYDEVARSADAFILGSGD